MSSPFARTVPASFAAHSWASSSSPYATSSSAAHANLLGGGLISRSPPSIAAQHTEFATSYPSGPASPVWRSSPTGIYPRRHRGPSRQSRIQLNFDPFADTPADPLPSLSSKSMIPSANGQNLSFSSSPRLPVHTTNSLSLLDHLRSPPPLSSESPATLRIHHLSATPAPMTRNQSVALLPSNNPVSTSPSVNSSMSVSSADRNARSRLVAGILLNRVHAVGRPIRAPRCHSAPRQYVKSGLSRVVCVEA